MTTNQNGERGHTVNGIKLTLLALALSAASVWAQNTPGYNNRIPPDIMTPGTLETRSGTLKFFDGFPTKETTQKVSDNLDFLRGVEVFLNFVPSTSIEGLRRGMVGLAACAASDKRRKDSNALAHYQVG